MNYFSLNAALGISNDPNPEYPTVETLIRHLDLLGVARTLVHSCEACDYSPFVHNMRLLAQTGKQRDRLIPSFVITPYEICNPAEIAALRKLAASGTVRSFRVFPAKGRFHLREIERVLRQLAEFNPTLLMDRRGNGELENIRDMTELAERFPTVNFVLTQQMWGGFSEVMDMLWRRPNIYLDISWLHMHDILPVLKADFGVERLLFSLGLRAHGGAAQAVLAHSGFTAAEQELAAHGNLERMLGLSPLEFSGAARNDKPLWQAFRAGEGLNAAPVIDAHGHSGPVTNGFFIREKPDDYLQLQALSRRLERLGIKTLLISSKPALFGYPTAGNAELETAVRSLKASRLRGMLVYNPNFIAEYPESLFEDYFRRGFYAGFKIHPDGCQVPVGDPRYEPMWRCAERYRLPVLSHTWNGPYSAPHRFEAVAERYPDVAILLGHSGGGSLEFRLEAEAAAERFPNIFLETCGSFCVVKPLAETIRRVGAGKVVFGSDCAGHSIAFELGLLLSQDLPDDTLLPVLGQNMQNILERRKS